MAALTTENLTQSVAIPGMSRQSQVPVEAAARLSPTSMADECYINQRFANKLQAFLVGYVGEVTSMYSIFGE